MDETQSLSELGESGLIALAERYFRTDRMLVVPIGDDGAVYDPRTDRQVAVADAMVEGVHFDRAFCRPEAIGQKLVAINISDIAAMGGTPDLLLFTASMPGALPAVFADRLLGGVAKAATRYGATVVGGDVTGSPGPIYLSVSGLGRLVGRHPLRRSAARVGDTVYVTGSLGGAGLGLRILRGDLEATAPDAIARFLTPEARVEAGAALARFEACRAAMDLSDGLATDARRMARASGVDLSIELTQIPCHPEALAQLGPAKALSLALYGGEDFELLFTSSSAPPVAATAIGEVTQGEGRVRWVADGQPAEAPKSEAFDHFGPRHDPAGPK